MDHVVTDNINKNKDQLNDAIYNESMFHTNGFNLSSGTREPLPVVTVTLRKGKKNIETTVSGQTCLWDIRGTKSMINRKHTKFY